MNEQIQHMINQHGLLKAYEYCTTTYSTYRKVARIRNQVTGRRHFCHDALYRRHYVRSLLELRKVLRVLDKAAWFPRSVILNGLVANVMHLDQESSLAFSCLGYRVPDLPLVGVVQAGILEQ